MKDILGIQGIIGDVAKETEAKTKYPKATGFKLYREPVKNKMPGLADGDTEWDTFASFYGGGTPAEVKERAFHFIAKVNSGEITVALKAGKKKAD